MKKHDKYCLKSILVVALICPLGLSAFAQVIIKGKVTDDKGETLPSVSILERGTNNGTSTKEDGSYGLKLTTPNSVLIFSFIGLVL